MNKLSDEEIEYMSKCLTEGKPLPDSYRYIIPFETKKEYELTYEGKEREEEILADTMAVPLQPVKTFGDGNGGWTNKLIFGDNHQVLKALMDDPEVYDKNAGKGKVRLIYIDPPFATKQEFRGTQDQKAYQDKIIGAQFLEFLRKRLVFLRELLADDGSIYVQLDWRKAHYFKTLMDEIFGEHNLVNEIIWNYKGTTNSQNMYARKHETIYFYTKNWGKHIFNPDGVRIGYDDLSAYKKDKGGKWYKQWTKERRHYPAQEFMNGEWVLLGKYRYDVWDDVPSMATAHGSEYLGFPNQKKERLLEIIIKASSNPGDIVLDAFAGSGTIGAVAEKLGRRWIMIDCGKLAIYTMQKRLLNLKEKIGNKGKALKPKPFTLYNAGLYNYKMVKDLPRDKYREFVLKLFQCRDEKHRIAGVELDGYLGAGADDDYLY